jgi:hypothetical protein
MLHTESASGFTLLSVAPAALVSLVGVGVVCACGSCVVCGGVLVSFGFVEPGEASGRLFGWLRGVGCYEVFE